MSTVAEKEAPVATVATGARPVYKVTALRVVRSEWAKFWSLRSSWITLGLAVLFIVAFGLIRAAHYKSDITSGHRMDPDVLHANGVELLLTGRYFGELALGVLGVLVTAGEYSTGMIRSTLAAVPRRLPVLWSKAAVYGVIALVVGTVSVFVAFLVGTGLLSGTPAAISFSGAGVVRSLLMAGLFLGLIGVIGAALGSLLRSVAGGISVLVAVLLLIPGLITMLPTTWQNNVNEYLPSNAGESMFALHHAANTLTPSGGLAVLLGWTVLALGGAAYRLVRTDA